MADHSTPNDPKTFMLNAFIAFAVVFVFAMIMMLWHGDYKKEANGKLNYNTKVIEPASGY